MLITLYCFVVVLLTQAVGLLALNVAEVRAAERLRNQVQVQYLAEAAVDRAIASLRSPAFVAGVADRSGDDLEIPYAALGTGGYEVDVDPVPGRPNIFRINATSYFPRRDTTAVGFVRRALEAYARTQPAGRLPPGLVGDRGVTLSGSVRVDSYDSSRGGTPRSTGHGLIGSNGSDRGAITINGSVDVFGDVLAGPGAPRDAILIIGSSRVSGQIGAAAEAYSMLAVNEAAGTEDLSLSGNRTLTLPGGTYRYKQVSISGRARLIFTGPATIYAETVSLSGNSITTADNRPTNLSIKVPGGGGVSLSGTSDFYGLIYAPESQISMSGSNALYGAVVGRTIRLSGSVNFWYDEALNRFGGGGSSNQVSILSWTETP